MEDSADNRDLSVSSNPATKDCGPPVTQASGLEAIPPQVQEEFPRLEPITGWDLTIIGLQLGRPPRGETFVACRCALGRPAVILTLPYDGAGRPVPPLLWLSCPYQVRAIARMESDGTMRRFGDALDCGGADDEEKRLFMEGERRFARVQALLEAGGAGAPIKKLEKKGVAGGRPGAVKCLHAHLAYRLASGRGVIGGWCLDELDKNKGRICERIPEACLT